VIVRVRRFGGSRIADPPAWGIIELPSGGLSIFHGVPESLFGGWYLSHGKDWWPVADSEVPDEVWAALAKWRLSQ
jgi:hypothetical protein